ncbi:MAG: peptidylprolyl isomerase [Chitinophagaceae bacterium]
MSVIQQIQEKYAKLMAIIIAIALLTFVIMLAFENGGSLFRNNGNVIGKVNGIEINHNEFRKKVDQHEEYLKSQGYNGSIVSQQAIESAWEGEVNRLLMASEIEKLGMQIGKRELGDILYGANPPQYLKQMFSDPKTGVYDARLAKSKIDESLKKGKADQRAELNAYIRDQEFVRMNEKYNALLGNSINFPKWFVEKQNADNSQLAKISFVREVYSSIPDSSIVISDKEIQDYVDAHKTDPQFKQEENRSIAYVSFSALPTAADTAAALKGVGELKPEFDSTADVESFVTRYGSAIKFTNDYFSKAQLQTANQQMGSSFKDTILTLPKNAVYGPYLEGGTYVLAKMVDTKVLPDTVKCRHILLGTMDPQTQQPLMDDSVAHRLADSISLAIKNGANFDTLETRFTTDAASHREKGVMTFSSTQIQGDNFAPEFAQFILFDGKPGDKKVVKTSFGWHYIEILNFIKPETHYQVAYMAKPIEASEETEANASNEANQFAGVSRDQKSFDLNAEKLRAKKINKLYEQNITPNSYQLPSLGVSRAFVKNIYAADLGDVLAPERVGENWVVAMVTEVNKKGVRGPKLARLMVEPILKNHKKAEQISKKIGNAASLEAAATALGGKQIETADSIRFQGAQASIISYEPKVIGAAFNPANKGKISAPIEGTSGVYVVRVDNISATAVGDANVSEQRKLRAQQVQMQNQQMLMQSQGQSPALNALREAASITDNRTKLNY